MAYRDELEAAREKAEALAKDLEREQAEKERLRRELEQVREKEEARRKADEELARLADEGQERREERQRASRQPRRAKQWRDKSPSRLRNACHRLGFVRATLFDPLFWFASWLVGFAISNASLFLLVKLGVLVMPVGYRNPDGVVVAWAGAAGILLPIGLVVASLMRGGSALEQERRWCAALPFELDGHEEAIGGALPAPEQKLRIYVRHAGEPLTLSRLADLLAAVGFEFKIEKVEPRTLSFWLHLHTATEWGAGRKVRRAIHELCERILVPLHQSHPIKKLKVTLER